MEDQNLIAYLFPKDHRNHEKHSWKAICMKENLSRFMPSDSPLLEEPESDYSSQESTETCDSTENVEAASSPTASYPGLRLTFSPGPKGYRGLELGTDPDCDIVLPKLKYIGKRHCALTFDDQRRLILRDFSVNGTSVSYNDNGRETRRNFEWILGGHKVPTNTAHIVIFLHGVNFRIVVSQHDENSSSYNASVDQFLQQVKKNEELHFRRLGMQSPILTALLTGEMRPTYNPIRLKQETLGRGAFAVVTRYWDVSTGLDYAYKEPDDSKKLDRKAWENEANMMRRISHTHVVKFMDDMTADPCSRLILEYVPFGSLEHLANISEDKCLKILCQGLSALMHLHVREEPIVHRDIKPANILVQSWDPLHIKLSDFGLASASKDLITFCGTNRYLAPEVCQGVERARYTSAVDIWSLGVVVFEVAYGLPDHHRIRTTRWCETIIKKVRSQDSDDLVDFLSDSMLIIDPKLRLSAVDCYHKAIRIPDQLSRRSLTPTPTSYAKGESTVVYNPRQTLLNVRSSSSQSSTPMYHNIDTPEDAPPDDSSSRGRHTELRKRRTVAGEFNPSVHMFGKNWLQDPNCVGSYVADKVIALERGPPVENSQGNSTEPSDG